MIKTFTYPLLIGTSLALSACSAVNQGDLLSDTNAESIAVAGMADGELKVPSNYRSWPVFLSDIQKAEAGQIRDIYISPLGHKTVDGQAFPDGSISVMEIWKPMMKSDGTPEMTAEGNMIKDELSLIFLMGKSQGADAAVQEDLRNGDWVYAAYQADGLTPGGPDGAACRACHNKVADKDWVFRYDEYFAQR